MVHVGVQYPGPANPSTSDQLGFLKSLNLGVQRGRGHTEFACEIC